MSSCVLYIVQNEAKNLLHGQWKKAITAELFTIVCELTPAIVQLYIFSRFNTREALLWCGLFLFTDWLLLSPLKAGKSLFYKHIATKTSPAPFALLFHYFRKGYGRAVLWRTRLWATRYGYWFLFLLPCSALLFWYNYLGNRPVLSLAALVLAIILGVFALLITEICMLRLLPTVYFLPYNIKLKRVFALAKFATVKQMNRWVMFHISYLGWFASLAFFIPFFYVSPLFQTARAATADKIVHEILNQPLQHWKNHGKILSEFKNILEEP